MSKKNNESLNNTSFWLFPERVKPLFSFLILILVLGIAIAAVVLLYSNRKYQYIPDYSESQYSEDVNTALLILSNYTKGSDSDEVVKTNRIIASYAKSKKNDSCDIINVRFNLIGAKKDNIEYLSEYNRTTKLENYQMTHTFTSLTSNSKQDYDRVYVKTAYDYVDNNQVTTRKYQTYLQKIMTISNEEIKNTTKDEILEQTNIFSNHVVRRKSDSDSDYRVYADLYFKKDNFTKYKLDYQLYGIDDNGEVYTLLGYYNISTNTYGSISRGVTYPKDLDINTFIAKANFLDEKGQMYTFISKVAIKEE